MIGSLSFRERPAAARVSSQVTAAKSSSVSTSPVAGAPASGPITFAEVANAARAALDAGYEKLGRKGDEYTTGQEWNDVVGVAALDRRTLYAIASNQGGLFSKDEVAMRGA